MSTLKPPFLRRRPNPSFNANPMTRGYALRTDTWGGAGASQAFAGIPATTPLKGDLIAGSMRGRRTSIRSPWDTFSAVVWNFPAGAVINEAETITINDGQHTLVLEWDSNASVVPGNIAVAYTGGMTNIQTFANWITQVINEVAAGRFDVDIITNGVIGVGATGATFISRRTGPAMYAWGDAWGETMLAWNSIQGWGNDHTAATRNAWGTNWMPIRWGLSRGWGAIEGHNFY